MLVALYEIGVALLKMSFLLTPTAQAEPKVVIGVVPVMTCTAAGAEQMSVVVLAVIDAEPPPIGGDQT
jgi:hypothetical protein